MSLRALIAFLLVVLAWSAHAEEPQWLIEARAKEGKLVKPKRLQSPDRYFRAMAPARLAGKVTASDSAYEMHFNIGADAPIICELIPDGFDPGALLQNTAEVTFAQLEEIQGKIGQRVIEGTDAGAFGAHPFLAVDWLYTVEVGGEVRLGLLKQIAVLVEERGLYCAHIELGYSNSFRSVVAALAESLQFRDSAEQPYYAEVHTTSMLGRRFGTLSVALTRDEDGDTKVVTRSSMLLAVTPETLNTSDTFEVQWAHPDGALINTVHVAVENGEIATNLRLSPVGEMQWKVEGQYMGKPLNEMIEAADAPSSALGIALARRQLLASGEAVGSEGRGWQWTSGDPARFHELTTTVLAAAEGGSFNGREHLAGMTADLVMDTDGSILSASMEIGPSVMQMERVHVQGSF